LRRYHSLASRRVRQKRDKVFKRICLEPEIVFWIGSEKATREKYNSKSWNKRRPLESNKYSSSWNQIYKREIKVSDKKKIDSLKDQLIELNNKEWLDKRDEDYYWSVVET